MKGPDLVAVLLALSWMLYIVSWVVLHIAAPEAVYSDKMVDNWRDLMLVVTGALSGYIARGTVNNPADKSKPDDPTEPSN